MILFSLAFLVGDLFLQHFSALPTNSWMLLFVLICVTITLILRKYWLFGFLLGFLWCACQAKVLLSWELPHSLESKSVQISGVIASLPIVEGDITKFNFAISPQNIMVRLSWQGPPEIHVGERWLLTVRMKRIHGSLNPGGFDFEAWALQKHLRAMGYVTNGQLVKKTHQYFLEQVRERIEHKILTVLPISETAPWLMALMIGERHHIPPKHWESLRNTGTNHLMAIAGLHIGFLFATVYALIALIWRQFPSLLMRMSAWEVASSLGLMAALIYSALAGFSLPTQRAAMMLILFTIAYLSHRRITAWQSWSAAILMVLILNPLSPLSESFWLSFTTIAVIIYGMQGRLAPQGWWWQWGRVQWVIGVGLIPLSLLIYQECSFSAFIANCIAIPWLAFTILPFCFVSLIFLFIAPTISAFLLMLADKSLAGLWFVLTTISNYNVLTWHQGLPLIIFLALLIGCLILLAPRGLPGRWLGMVWLFPVIFYHPAKPKANEIWMTLLDVGQGLSVIIETASHVLVYDTGPAYPTGLNMGESVVLPFLQHRQLKNINTLVISHADNDHRGGAYTLLSRLPVQQIFSSVPEKFIDYKNNEVCIAGKSWQWDGVTFSFLYPDQAHLQLGNNSSCVLRIDNGKESILLTGDIEKLAEKFLLQHQYSTLKSSIIVVPHHGSKTSGLKTFIAAVNPKLALFPFGYRNRYHFPHASVVQTYIAQHVSLYDSVKSGAITVLLNSQGISVQQYRLSHKRYWNA